MRRNWDDLRRRAYLWARAGARHMRSAALRARPRRCALLGELGPRPRHQLALHLLELDLTAIAPDRKSLAYFTSSRSSEGWRYFTAVIDVD